MVAGLGWGALSCQLTHHPPPQHNTHPLCTHLGPLCRTGFLAATSRSARRQGFETYYDL
jgi:hypothetical protein